MQDLEHIHGGNINLASRKYNLPVHKLLDFSANINPLGPSPKSITAVMDNLNPDQQLSDPDCRSLAVLANHLGVWEELLLMETGPQS